MRTSRFLLIAALGAASWLHAEVTFTMAPRVAAVERDGVTGGGTPVAGDDRAMLFYPNHPDDFGGTNGSGTSVAEDGGRTWKPFTDDWPIAKTVDLWADRLRSGGWIAFGLHWVPDAKTSGPLGPKDVPHDAFTIAWSRDEGRTWRQERAVIDYGAEIGIVARPLPHIFEAADDTLLMPAYAWAKTGSSMLLLASADRGRRWTVRSVICKVADIIRLGVPVSTRWLETTVSPTSDGSLLAIMRTGSSVDAVLVSARSSDGGKTWSPPQKVTAGPQNSPVAGKLPTLALLKSGVLVLLTAHSKNHCRIHASADGTGRVWGLPQVITSQSGGNAGLCVTPDDRLIVTTPMTARIHAWTLTAQRRRGDSTETLKPPTNVVFKDDRLAWTASSGAVAYRITPVLQKVLNRDPGMQMLPYVPFETLPGETSVDLSRRLIQGSPYVCEIVAVDAEGRVSDPVRTGEIKTLR